MNALANPEVGKYLNEYFVSSYQKVATFKIVNGQKQGGNVASYFCTPTGQVLHVLAGPPVNGQTLLREARWVVETWKLAVLEGREEVAQWRALFRAAHAERLRQEHGQHARGQPLVTQEVPSALAALLDQPRFRGLSRQGLVHLLLSAAPLPRVGQVYQAVESPRGELGVHLVSDGGTRPYRVHYRDPSFTNLQATAAMSEGGMIADVIAAVASIDPVMGGVDR